MLLDQIINNNKLQFYRQFYKGERKGSWKGYFMVK